MKAPMHRFILHNDELAEASDKLLSPGQIGLLSGWGVFSTIKVIAMAMLAKAARAVSLARSAALIDGSVMDRAALRSSPRQT